MRGTSLLLLLALIGGVAVAAVPASGQPPRGARPAPRRSDDVHHPDFLKNWKFTFPKGDPAKGRAAFGKFECYACHEVRGESFPALTDQRSVGPELSVMGPLHGAEYFVDAIIDPSATIEKGKGYQAPDGSSKMPSYNDSMTVQELIDLVAFLRDLRPPSGGPGARQGAPSGGHNQH